MRHGWADKVVASRKQEAYVIYGSIYVNILLTHEFMYDLEGTSDASLIAIKSDMDRAYDAWLDFLV